MTLANAREFIEILKSWPAPTTMIVLLGMVGFITYAHFYSHARRADLAQVQFDMSSLQAEVKAGRAETLEGQLFESKVSQCKATGDMRRIYAQRVSSLQARYRNIFGVSYSLPECNEL